MPDDLIRTLFDGFIGHIYDLEPTPTKNVQRLLHFFIYDLELSICSGS